MKKKAEYRYLSEAQAKAEINDCKYQFHEIARGGGKSNGIHSRKIEKRAIELPRSTGLFAADTYKQFWTRIYPSLAKGLDSIGYKLDINFWVGQKPPAKLVKNLPYETPKDLSNFMFFYAGNGSATGMHIGSLERASSIDGLNTDWLLGDECKTWNEQRFEQGAVPTLRGNEDHFGHSYLHKSICLTTSPASAIDNHWFEKFEFQHTGALIDFIEASMYNILDYRHKIADPKYNEDKKPGLQRKLAKLETQVDEIRKKATYYQRASSFSNIHVLTPDYIDTQRRILNDSDFAALILALRQKRVKNGFYAHLSIARHTYKDQGNISIVHTLNYDPAKLANDDCRFDTDINANRPLELAVDFNVKISSLAIGQQYEWGYRFVNHLYIEHPELIKGLAEKFNEYYKYHPNKELTYIWYLSENKRNLDNSLKDAEQFASYLTKLGWKVSQVKKGIPPNHWKRYNLMQKLLGSIDGQRIEFNYYNCYDILNAMLLTPTRHVGDKIEKDKKSERNNQLPPQHTTNVTDPVDTLLSHHYLDNSYTSISYIPPQTV